MADVEQALQLVQQERYQVAVLDIHLGSGTSLHLASTLQKIGLPWVFLTGYGDQLTLPEPLAVAPRLSKPVNRDQLAAAIRSVVKEQT